MFNGDPEKSRGHFLLNYASGGYGLGQILLSLEKSLANYDAPFVVFGFLTYDIDRSVLSVRIGQKPYFVLEDDELLPRAFPSTRIPSTTLPRTLPRCVRICGACSSTTGATSELCGTG